MKSMCVALPVAMMGSVQAEMVIDFSNAECFPTGRDTVQINDIRVDTEVINPFNGETDIFSVNYDVPFKLDMGRLVLVPYLEGAVSDNDNRNCAALTVVVNNAVTGEPISGVPVNIGAGNIMYTGASGMVNFDGLSDGMVEVTANGQGFNNMDRAVSLSCGANNSMAFNLNPTEGENALNANEVRIVLSWGEHPADLDAHLTGPFPGQNASSSNEEDRFHIYWYFPEDSDIAWLDVDDVDSYGPETVTIFPAQGESQSREGVYRYTVYQYEGMGIIDDAVTVELYIGNNPVRTFKPPVDNHGVMISNTEGNTWTVLELRVNNSGAVSVHPVNTLSFSEEMSSSVRSAKNGSAEPVSILYGK